MSAMCRDKTVAQALLPAGVLGFRARPRVRESTRRAMISACSKIRMYKRMETSTGPNAPRQ